MKKLNGIRLKHRKNTENSSTVVFPIPQKVRIPMSMTMGAPCQPLVKVGDEVKVGQKIGDSDVPFSAPVHSGVSGKVVALTDYRNAMGAVCKMVEIETDGQQTVSEEVKPPVVTDKESFVKAVRESGACGLGGAGFPTHIKLNPKSNIDTLIINAAECEPYITADYREMMENPQDIINGINMVKSQLGIKWAKLAIEANKPEAIKHFTEMAENDDTIDIITLPSAYPQGAEKVIIYNSTGRIVNEGTLPADAGVIVMNVSTVAFLYRYMQTGMPLVTRRLTIDGNAVGEPKNVSTVIGTSFRELLEFCKTDIDSIKKLIAGGPMMGMSVPDIDMPVVKTSNALLAFNHYDERKTSSCIRCGRCVRVCPLGLMPADIDRAFKIRNIDELKQLKVMLCMNCGSCTYVCPANRKLAETNQLAKALIPRK
ncbi:electron transport complex subunit RsxC [Ruminococcus flavefaciens]|uniref:electron transport complex subunit RsxC n=1 Tax=Ruminococcus flavefaciens TaxID=1265 RepID=UPI00048E9A9C|nr:electron transport complex subunit RsxC [Ruminococcus flavefaciens]